MRIVIAGGGTGGHLYPGIAVARELLARRSDTVITFAGTARGIESRVVPRERRACDGNARVQMPAGTAASHDHPQRVQLRVRHRRSYVRCGVLRHVQQDAHAQQVDQQ